ncbi:MAG TPA: hypothetical protein VN039_08020, partial [Nitrospira sp.]|nr:hypothetical protein [Nitrospira sp.]
SLTMALKEEQLLIAIEGARSGSNGSKSEDRPAASCNIYFYMQVGASVLQDKVVRHKQALILKY